MPSTLRQGAVDDLMHLAVHHVAQDTQGVHESLAGRSTSSLPAAVRTEVHLFRVRQASRRAAQARLSVSQKEFAFLAEDRLPICLGAAC
jgi:hypothetical protein